jgi:uncharacterized protein YjdB
MKKRISFLAVALMLFMTAAFAQVEQIPTGYVSLYSVMAGLDNATEKAGTSIAHLTGTTNSQLLGNPNGWGTYTGYDVFNYEKLEFKFTFDAADAGKQIAIRYSVNAVVKYKIITCPVEAPYESVLAIDTHSDDLPAANGKIGIGGIVVYNGSSHSSFAYTTEATTNAITLNYVAVKIALPTAIEVVADNPVLAQALPVGGTTTLKAQFTPVYTTNKAVTWSSADEGIATVNASTGEVTGVAGGSVAITATSVEVPSTKLRLRLQPLM